MGPENYKDEEKDQMEKDRQRILVLYEDFFKFLNSKFNIKIFTGDLIHFAEENDPHNSPVVLAKHIVYLIMHSFLYAMYNKESLTKEDTKLIMQIQGSIIHDEYWNFDPDDKYIKLARSYLRKIHK